MRENVLYWVILGCHVPLSVDLLMRWAVGRWFLYWWLTNVATDRKYTICEAGD